MKVESKEDENLKIYFKDEYQIIENKELYLEFENNNDYEVIIESFIKKFKKHFSSGNAEINSFI